MVERIIICGTEKRAAMYYRWLNEKYEIIGFISEKAVKERIFQVPVLGKYDIEEIEYDKIVLVVETRIIKDVERWLAENYKIDQSKVVSIDELVIRSDGVNDYVEYTTERQLKYYIFGAHSRGQTMAVYLRKLYPNWKFLGYMFDNDEDNPSGIEGAPVIDLGNPEALDTVACVYVATRSVFHEHIFEHLKQLGFTDIVPVDVMLDNKLRNDFVREYFKEAGRSFDKIEDIMPKIEGEGVAEQVTVYVVRSAVDLVLEGSMDLAPHEKYIQAGRALADIDLDRCDCFDNFGDNISSRNRQMCELTAMYWIWKNANQNIVGVEHYRRRFILPSGWRKVFSPGKADAILPVPLYVRPSLKANYVSRHIGEIWDVMMRKLRDIHGADCAFKAEDYFERTGCYSPCNMLITKKNVYDELCEWLFPVLFAIVEECGEVDDKYQNRYPGFLAERLISFFFYLNAEKYKVIYADKVFLSSKIC